MKHSHRCSKLLSLFFDSENTVIIQGLCWTIDYSFPDRDVASNNVSVTRPAIQTSLVSQGLFLSVHVGVSAAQTNGNGVRILCHSAKTLYKGR
jgi:hypothetical protein